LRIRERKLSPGRMLGGSTQLLNAGLGLISDQIVKPLQTGDCTDSGSLSGVFATLDVPRETFERDA
jgi:hypothetical protein